jgi:uncharacterized protein (TIGR00255 family)
MTTLSMTGFGESRATVGTVEISVEIKTVNQRFLDVVTKLPAAYCRFDLLISSIVKEVLRRGRVEVFVGRKETGVSEYEVAFNRPLFQTYVQFIRQALAEVQLEDRQTFGASVLAVLGKREVLELVAKEQDASAEEEALKVAVQAALADLLKMRQEEGSRLEVEIRSQLTALRGIVDVLREKVAQTPELFRQRLAERLERLAQGVEFDETRLAQELALLADRIDVTEELARLQSHFEQFESIIENGEGGRKLEFLLQEIGREINTTGSKAQNGEVTSLIVEAKSVVEKLREQVQNIE